MAIGAFPLILKFAKNLHKILQDHATIGFLLATKQLKYALKVSTIRPLLVESSFIVIFDVIFLCAIR